MHNHDEKRIDEAGEEPDLDILDRGGGGETVGDGDVESRENHHAGDVDHDDSFKDIVASEVVGCLVDDIDQNCRQVSYEKDAG